jgi:hypothetical protein
VVVKAWGEPRIGAFGFWDPDERPSLDLMPWLIKGLLLAAKTRRGRRLLLAGLVGVFRLSRSAEARKAYAKSWTAVRATSGRVGSFGKAARVRVAGAKR